MENYIKIGYEVRDGRMYLDLGTSKDSITYAESLTVVLGSLSMLIRVAGEKGYKTEGEILRDVISHLESEFINADSFKDLKIKR